MWMNSHTWFVDIRSWCWFGKRQQFHGRRQLIVIHKFYGNVISMCDTNTTHRTNELKRSNREKYKCVSLSDPSLALFLSVPVSPSNPFVCACNAYSCSLFGGKTDLITYCVTCVCRLSCERNERVTCTYHLNFVPIGNAYYLSNCNTYENNDVECASI